MKKLTLKLYESSYPPTDINTLWVDKDENTGKIKAIHEYNKSKGEWEPSMVSIDYLKGDSTDTYTVRFSVPTEYTSKDNWDTVGGLKETLTEFMTSHAMNATALLTNPNQKKVVGEGIPKSEVTQLLYDMHDNSLSEYSMISSCFTVEKDS